MKLPLYLALATLILAGCTAKSTENWDFEAEKSAILDVLSNQQDAWNSGDLEKFMIGYLEADSLMFIGSSGVIYGYNNTLERYKRNYSSREIMGTLEFEVKELKPVTQDVFFMVGSYHLQRDSIDDARGIFTLVWKKLDGKWVIVADHSE